MNQPTKTTGVILAGGLARRMNQQDKGLVCYQQQPLIYYAIAALTPLVDEILINANRNLEHYQQFGLAVISDQTNHFDGPLAGILTAIIHNDADVFLIMPCDAPLMTAECLQQLVDARAEADADSAVAFDGERQHSVFLAVHRRVQASLADYLASGQRKVQTWLALQHTISVDLCRYAEQFVNINSLEQLHLLETTSQL